MNPDPADPSVAAPGIRVKGRLIARPRAASSATRTEAVVRIDCAIWHETWVELFMTEPFLLGLLAMLRQVREQPDLGPDPDAGADPADDVWADGGMKVTEAVAFSGLGRDALWELMNLGELVWAARERDRVIARRGLVRYLASITRTPARQTEKRP